jgi:hypothetical protein
MKRLPLIITTAGCTALLATFACAESSPGPTAETGYQLKNRSSFRSDPDARIPFWPIGWQRPKNKGDGGGASTVVETPSIQLQPQNFNITSILLGNPALVTINGRSFEEGEVLPVFFGDKRLRVIVRSVRDGGVWLDYEGQQTFVPMQRREVGVKRVEQKPGPAEFAIKIGPGQR